MKKNYLKTMALALGLLGWSATTNAQFSESFEGAGTPVGWTVIDNDGQGNTWTFQAPSDAGSVQDGVQVSDIEFESAAHDDYLITPQIAVVDGSTDQLRFYSRNRSSTFQEQFNVLISTAGNTAADFTTTLAGPLSPTTGSWDELVYDLSVYEGQNIYIAFQAISTNEFSLYIDDVNIEAVPTCPAPTALTVFNLAGFSTDLAWTENGSASSWQIEYDTLGFTQGTGTLSVVGNDTTTISSLTPETDYEFYVRAICGPGDSSVWVGPIAFTTTPSCPAPTALNFTNPTATTTDLTWTQTGSPASWQMEYGATGFTQGAGTISLESNDTATVATTLNSDYDFYVRAICGAGDTSTWAGPFTFHTGYCISIPTSHDNNGISNIMVGATNFAGTSIEYLDFTGGTIVDLAQGVQANLQITFETGYDYDANVWIDLNDNFVFESTELLFQGTSTTLNPTTLDASFPMLATAPLGNHYMRIGTADGGQAPPNPCYSGSYGVTADFIINVIAAPACLPVTALTATNIYPDSAQIGWTLGGSETAWNIQWGTPGFAPGTGAELGAASYPTTSYMITGLTPNTSYEIYVQANCGTDSSTWVGPLTVFTGYCNVSSTDPSRYINNFSTTGGIMNITNNASGYSPNGYQNATSMIVAQFNGGALVNFSTDILGGTFGFNIWVDWNSDLIFDDITEKMYASGAYVSTATGSFSIPVGTPVGDYRMRILADWNLTDPSACGTLSSGGEAEDYTFSVVATPSCLPITGLTVNNATTDSLMVSWAAGGIEANWVIEWGLPGFTPGTGTGTGSTTSNNLTDTISGLNSSTTYDVYVRADCGSGDSSYWTLVQGTTLCAPLTTLPWTENFDAMTAVGPNLFPNCWINETGDWATSSGSTNFLTDGQFAFGDFIWTPEFALDSGITYEFSFSWNGNGQTGWDAATYVSTSQSSTDAVILDSIVNSTELTSLNYSKVKFCFTPDSSYSYSFGLALTSNGANASFDYDDFSLRIPPNNAGVDGATTVCQVGGLVDLNSIITINDTTGIWAFSPNPSAIVNDTSFNPAFIPSGTTTVYFVTNGCYPDSAMATINIYPKSNAGTDGTISRCNYGPVNLFDGLTGSVDLGGIWHNPAGQAITGSIVNFNGEIAANYNYIYIVGNSVCPVDTSVIEIQLNDCAGVDEYELKGFVLYPNPSNGVINIQYAGKGEDVKLDVVDTKGAIVWTKQVLFNDGTTQTIDLSGVETGTYYINMTSKNGGSVMKVIKN